MVTRRTQKPVSVTLDKSRKNELDDLVASWSMTEKRFILQSLKDYHPSTITPTRNSKQKIKEFFFGKEPEPEEEKTFHLANKEIFTNPNVRYGMTGEKNPRKAMHKIFQKEVSSDDKTYLLHTLEKETDDVYIPPELIEEFSIGHRRHHLNLLMEENAPKAPFYLVLGPTGSGKTKTINKAIEQALFSQELEVKQKVADDLEKILEEHPFMARIDLAAVAPEIAERIKEEKRRKRLRKLSKIPLIGRFYRKETAELLEKNDEEFGMAIDLDQINPNNVQTMWYGETGNKMMQSFGTKEASIRILEEAHALLSVHESRTAQVQEETLVSTFNIIMDQIEKGERNCMVIALSRKGEEFHEDIYRRFQEKGRIIDMSKYWKNPETIEKLIEIESLQQDIELPNDVEKKELADKVLEIFEHRGLDITPAYVRKLIASVAELKGELKMEYLNDGILVREAFVNVARNLYPEMFKKTYNRLTRGVKWEDYVGEVKEEFQRSANQCLFHDLSAEKGAVLAGPPGTGKTFLARTYLSRHKEISDVTLKMEDLQDKRDPIDGPVKKLAEAFDIAKMCAPTLLFIDEGEAVAMERQGNITDRITNKLLNAIDGETELKGTYVVLTTNNPEHLAKAATRSGRLKVMAITGKLNQRDIYRMLENYLKGETISPELTNQRIYSMAKQICSTPADYSKFFETILNFKNEEKEVIRIASTMTSDKDLEEFISSNYKVMLGIVESLGFNQNFIRDAKKDVNYLVKHKNELMEKITEALIDNYYPITSTHLERAREDRIQTPKLKGKISLDDYLQSQLSSEPQVGFVIGAGANETMGLLVPIRSSIIYDGDNSAGKTIVTGAVSSNNPQAAELSVAVEMTKQSSKEALTLVLNYLDSLMPEKDVKRIIGTYLKDRYLHHQFLTTNYMSGGPSAGMALTINTLSTILNLPVRHDFGITGAPWSGGKTKKNVGSAVIIGGAHHKTQMVLSYLDRMYVPQQNLKDVDFITLENYWQKGKDVIGYDNFSSIVGEVYSFGDTIKEEMVKTLFEKRIEAKRCKLVATEDAQKLFEEVEILSTQIRTEAENLIRNRVGRIEQYLRDKEHDEFKSLQSIFE